MKNMQENLEEMEKRQKKASEDAKKELGKVKVELEQSCTLLAQDMRARIQDGRKEGAESQTALEAKIKGLEQEFKEFGKKISAEMERLGRLSLQPQMVMGSPKKEERPSSERKPQSSESVVRLTLEGYYSDLVSALKKADKNTTHLTIQAVIFWVT